MKKLFYVLTGLCLLAGIFTCCEDPLKEPDNPNEGGGTGGGSSQKGMIEGVVTSKSTDRPVMLASVTLLPTNTLTLTDTAGSFTLDNIEPGTYKIQVKRSGYATYTSGDIKVTAGKTVRHNVTLDVVQSDLQIQDINGEVIEELLIENDATRGTFVLKNAGGKIIEWEIPKLAVDWISDFSMQSGKLAPGASETISFSVDRSKLSDGANETTLYIGSSVGDKELQIKVGVERSFCLTAENGEELLEVDMSDVDQYRFTIKNTGNDALQWRLGEIEANWLTIIGKTDGKLAAGDAESRTLKVDRTYLEEGSYETTLVVHSNAGEKTLPVKVKIEMSFSLENEQGVEITELEFGSASSKNFKIRNTGNGVLAWEVSSVWMDWLTLGSKRSGSLQLGAVETITVTIDRTKLSVGDNHATINISTNAGDKQLDVSEHVELSYQLVNEQEAEISELNLGRTPQGMFKIKNTGNGVLEWEISSINVDWLALNGVTQGQIQPNDATTIELTVDLNKVTEGTNETTLYISSPAGDKQLPVRYLKSIGAVGSDYVETIGDIELQMVAVEGGMFEMGATSEQGSDAEYSEKPVHSVLLDGFYIGKYEVTRAQWEAVMGTEPSAETERDNLPVAQVSWEDVQEFCKKLSELTGKTYRLPTEAEWEYAARGGNKSQHYKYAGSNNINEVAWYAHPYEDLLPGGWMKANELDIYDMSGNVWEWCSDWYGSYSSSPAVNPQGPANGTRRVYRGGSKHSNAVDCRVSCRHSGTPDYRYYVLGFRVACSAE